MMAGDAGSFLDPVFSSGVAIAMESGLEAAQAIDAGLAPTTSPPARFAGSIGVSAAGIASFRRFVLAFYTRGFRDLFFSPDPPRRMFTAIITVLAGYWHPSWRARVWLWLFFLTVRLQVRLKFAPSYLQPVADPPAPDCTDTVAQ